MLPRSKAVIASLCLIALAGARASATERWAVLPVGRGAPDAATADEAERLLQRAAEQVGAEAGAHVLMPAERDAAVPVLARMLGADARSLSPVVNAAEGLDRVVEPTLVARPGEVRLRLSAIDGQTGEALGSEEWAAASAPAMLALVEAQGPEVLRRLLTDSRGSGVPVRIVYSGEIRAVNGREYVPFDFGVRAGGRVFACPAMPPFHRRCTLSHVPPGPAELVAWSDPAHRAEHSATPFDVPPTGVELRVSSGGLLVSAGLWASAAVYGGLAVADVRRGGALSPPAALRDLPPGGFWAVGAALIVAMAVPATVAAGEHLDRTPLPAFLATSDTAGGDPAQFVRIRSEPAPDLVLDVGLEGAWGRRACRDGLSFDRPCRLQGLGPGPATLHVAAAGRLFSREIVLTAEPQEITVSYEPAPMRRGLQYLGGGALAMGFGWLEHYGGGDAVKIGWLFGICGALFAGLGVKELVNAAGPDEPTIEVRPLERASPGAGVETTRVPSFVLGPTAMGDGTVLSAAFTFQ